MPGLRTFSPLESGPRGFDPCFRFLLSLLSFCFLKRKTVATKTQAWFSLYIVTLFAENVIFSSTNKYEKNFDFLRETQRWSWCDKPSPPPDKNQTVRSSASRSDDSRFIAPHLEHRHARRLRARFQTNFSSLKRGDRIVVSGNTKEEHKAWWGGGGD